MKVVADEFTPNDESVWDFFYNDKHVASVQSNDVSAWQSFKAVEQFYEDGNMGKDVLLS